MEEFIKLLKDIFTNVHPVNNAYISKYHEDYGDTTEEDRNKVDEAEGLACEYLIGDGGYNWDNVQILEKEGIYVTTLERDSFGPLMAGISQRKHCGPYITFG